MAATSAVGRTGDLRLPASLTGVSLQAFMFEARGPLKPRNDRPRTARSRLSQWRWPDPR